VFALSVFSVFSVFSVVEVLSVAMSTGYESEVALFLAILIRYLVRYVSDIEQLLWIIPVTAVL
jgi:hypothetical protein